MVDDEKGSRDYLTPSLRYTTTSKQGCHPTDMIQGQVSSHIVNLPFKAAISSTDTKTFLTSTSSAIYSVVPLTEVVTVPVSGLNSTHTSRNNRINTS